MPRVVDVVVGSDCQDATGDESPGYSIDENGVTGHRRRRSPRGSIRFAVPRLNSGASTRVRSRTVAPLGRWSRGCAGALPVSSARAAGHGVSRLREPPRVRYGCERQPCPQGYRYQNGSTRLLSRQTIRGVGHPGRRARRGARGAEAGETRFPGGDGFERFDQASQRYLLELRGRLQGDDREETRVVLDMLENSFRRRTSGLADRDVWRALALPEGLLAVSG